MKLSDIAVGIRVAFDRGVTWSHDHQQLRVRAIDVRDLVPHNEWDQLVTANPKVMGGAPVFAGSRAPSAWKVKRRRVIRRVPKELDTQKDRLRGRQ